MTVDLIRNDGIDALLSIVESTREVALCPSLREITANLARALDYETVGLTLYRRAWDDLKTVVIHGDALSHPLQLGTIEPREVWSHRVAALPHARSVALVPPEIWFHSSEGALKRLPRSPDRPVNVPPDRRVSGDPGQPARLEHPAAPPSTPVDAPRRLKRRLENRGGMATSCSPSCATAKMRSSAT